VTDLYAGVVGPAAAVARLRAAARVPVHAYLFVGPPGTGMREAARGFAASLLCPDGGCGTCEHCQRALGERHPDLVVVERRGPYITVDDARAVASLAARTPAEGSRKVLLLVDFHLVREAAPALLKTLEEASDSTVFVVLAEHVPPELVTVASRCARVDFGPVPPELIVSTLVSEEVAEDIASRIAAASGGSLDRARLLARDPGFAARQAAWLSVPGRLDGTGATIAVLADQLLATVETVLEPLQARQAAEVAALEERMRRYGERGTMRKELEERHRREQRRARTDELRFGLAALAGAYRDQLLDGAGGAALDAVAAIQAAGEALVRNPNEALLLQGLLVRLTELAEGAGTAPGPRNGGPVAYSPLAPE
jgi:DNA polymerase-3 subunit delta'